jgi:DNA-binding GntR family transcriptional regulator
MTIDFGSITTLEPRVKGQSRLRVHARIRQLILDGTLAAGSTISQVELAHGLGVSRTPLREAIRMLQEEGLVVAEINRHTRVAGFKPEELDAVYGARVMMETLAISTTVDQLSDSDIGEMSARLLAMDGAAARQDASTWSREHIGFHSVSFSRANPEIKEMINAFSERAERYRAMYQHASTRLGAGREGEHEAIRKACAERSGPAAVVLQSRHLAKTALTLIAHMAPEYEPKTLRIAVQLAAKMSNGTGGSA